MHGRIALRIDTEDTGVRAIRNHCYDQFPKQLMQDWCGCDLVTPIKYPVPVRPVVPNYGDYLPEGNAM